MHAQRTLPVVYLIWLALAAVAAPSAAAELPTLPTIPDASASLEERRDFYRDHKITTQFMGMPCVYDGDGYTHFQLRHVIERSPIAAQHRRNALALKIIGLSVSIPSLVIVIAMIATHVDPTRALLVALIDISIVLATTIGQLVELDKSVQAYDSWLRGQLVLDPIGEALGARGGPTMARSVGLRW